jgi:hypothetical protein
MKQRKCSNGMIIEAFEVKQSDVENRKATIGAISDILLNFIITCNPEVSQKPHISVYFNRLSALACCD